MPELPEVEVVRRSLEEIFRADPEIKKVAWNRADLRFPLPLAIFRRLNRARVIAVERRAKYLRIEFSTASLVVHLGMTGGFRLQEATDELRKHDHVIFELGSGRRLVFEDPRRFGFMLRWPGSWESVSSQPLGSEPLDPAWTGEVLKSQLRGRQTPIKCALMDQRIVVGIGNIYASEILFRSGVRPQRRSGRVSLQECTKIVQNSRLVLLDAIRQGGSTIRDFHSAGEEAGSFQESHRVYGRAGKKCVVCSTHIKRSVLGGRSTFWCPSCQT